jgi:hypothetical protein
VPSNLYVNDVDTVVHSMSMLIRESLNTSESQRYYPDSNSDVMDAKINFYETRTAVLRDLRERFENEMARPLRREGE